MSSNYLGVHKLVCQFALASLSIFSLNCAAIAHEPVFSDDGWLDKRYDWTFYLKPKKLSHFLDYKSCSLSPAVEVSINYRVTAKLHPKTIQSVHYRDLWYHNQTPIGSKTFTDLDVKPGWQCAIVISPEQEYTREMVAPLANTIARLIVEIYNKKDSLTIVFAEPTIEQQLCDQFGQFRFFRTNDDTLDSEGTLRFVMTSGDVRDRTFMVYKVAR